jgi:hypothetical protein
MARITPPNTDGAACPRDADCADYSTTRGLRDMSSGTRIARIFTRVGRGPLRSPRSASRVPDEIGAIRVSWSIGEIRSRGQSARSASRWSIGATRVPLVNPRDPRPVGQSARSASRLSIRAIRVWWTFARPASRGQSARSASRGQSARSASRGESARSASRGESARSASRSSTT